MSEMGRPLAPDLVNWKAGAIRFLDLPDVLASSGL